MRFLVAREITRLFPELTIGVVRLEAVDNLRRDPALTEIEREAMERAKERLAAQPLGEQPFVVAWREAYRRTGSDPRRYRPSAEALLRRIQQGKALPSISPLVDISLYASVEHAVPVGGYALARITGDLELRRSPGEEPFVALGGSREHTDAGEVVYADAAKVLTRHWNHRDGELASIQPSTTAAILFCESPSSAIPPEQVSACAGRIASLAARYCGCLAAVDLVDAGTGSLEVLRPASP